MTAGAVQQVNITGNVTSPPNAFTTGSSRSRDNSCNNVAIGAGVGIPLGVLLLCVLAWGFWQSRRLSALRNRADAPSKGAAKATYDNPVYNGIATSERSMSEVPGIREPGELE